MDNYHYDVMGGNVGFKWNIYMETSCFCVFMLLNYMKAYVSMYFLRLMLTFEMSLLIPETQVFLEISSPPTGESAIALAADENCPPPPQMM